MDFTQRVRSSVGSPGRAGSVKRFTAAPKRGTACNRRILHRCEPKAMPSDDGLNARDRVCELFGALLKAPRTAQEIAEMTGMSYATVSHWLDAMSASGLAEPCGERKPKVGKAARLWALNPYPYMQREQPYAGPSRRVYVAGPMSGIAEHNFPAFHDAAWRLRMAGLDVVNPAELNPGQDGDWAACMRRDVAQMVTCDTVALLPGWDRSRGAQVEVRLARDLGLRVVELGTLLESAWGNAR